MSDDSLKALWQKTDKHAEEIATLNTRTSTHAVLIEKLEGEFARARLQQAESNAALKEAMHGYNDSVQMVLKGYHEQRGAAQAVKWAIGSLIAAAGVAATIYINS